LKRMFTSEFEANIKRFQNIMKIANHYFLCTYEYEYSNLNCNGDYWD
jgi:hypothetical protein